MGKFKDLLKGLSDKIPELFFNVAHYAVIDQEFADSNEKKDMVIKTLIRTNSVLIVGSMKARKDYLNYSVDNGIILTDVRVFSESMIQNVRGVDFKEGFIIDDSVTNRSLQILKMLYPDAKINGILRREKKDG